MQHFEKNVIQGSHYPTRTWRHLTKWESSMDRRLEKWTQWVSKEINGRKKPLTGNLPYSSSIQYSQSYTHTKAIGAFMPLNWSYSIHESHFSQCKHTLHSLMDASHKQRMNCYTLQEFILSSTHINKQEMAYNPTCIQPQASLVRERIAYKNILSRE